MAVLAAPFVRFLMALALGIGVGCAVVPTCALYLAAGGALIVVVSVFVTIRCMTQLRQHCYYPVLGVLILLAWGIIGCLLTWQTDPAIDRSHFSRFESKALTGWVADEPVVRGHIIGFPTEATHVYGADGCRRVA